MSKAYWVKKTPDFANEKCEWIQMTGIEFYQFINIPENKGRHFIDFDNMKIEVNKSEYVKWRKEKDASDYLKEQERKYITISIFSITAQDGSGGENLIEDPSVNIETEIEEKLLLEYLKKSLNILTPQERLLIKVCYFAEGKITDQIAADALGIPRRTFLNRKNKILEKLRKNMEG